MVKNASRSARVSDPDRSEPADAGGASARISRRRFGATEAVRPGETRTGADGKPEIIPATFSVVSIRQEANVAVPCEDGREPLELLSRAVRREDRCKVTLELRLEAVMGLLGQEASGSLGHCVSLLGWTDAHAVLAWAPTQRKGPDRVVTDS